MTYCVFFYTINGDQDIRRQGVAFAVIKGDNIRVVIVL